LSAAVSNNQIYIFMSKILNLKKPRWGWLRNLLVILSAVIITAIGIKASDSLSGKNKKNGSQNFCPGDMAYVTSVGGGFCLDRYEASAGSACPYTNPEKQSDTRVNLSESTCRPESQSGFVPWRFISQDQAAMACAKAGKRLPTNQEWLQASLGTPDIKANWGEDDCQVDNNWLNQPGLSGSGKNCFSPAGVYDMIGNVWEWVDGVVSNGIFNGNQLPLSGYIDSTDGESMPGKTNPDKANENYNNDYFWVKGSGSRAIARGGYWNNKSEGGQYSVYAVNPPSFAGEGVGFRCAKNSN
jgi:formylglycine-generating enzyme required for sulfatase activity